MPEVSDKAEKLADEITKNYLCAPLNEDGSSIELAVDHSLVIAATMTRLEDFYNKIVEAAETGDREKVTRVFQDNWDELFAVLSVAKDFSKSVYRKEEIIKKI